MITPNDLEMLIEDYLNRRRNSIKPVAANTVRIYRIDLSSFMAWWIKAETPIEELTQLDIRAYIRWLVTDRGHVATSVNRKVTVLRGLFDWLKSEKVVEASPVPEARRTYMKEPQRLPQYVNLDEARNIMSASLNQDTLWNSFWLATRDLAIIETLYATGIRLAELVGMDVGDIRFDQRIIKVLGKGNKEREVIFGTHAHRALDVYLKKVRPELVADPQDPAVWLNRYGKRISRRSIELMISKHGKAAGLEKLTPHVFRHGFATAMLNGGANIRTVQELLGHVSVTTTQIYTHIGEAEKQKTLLANHPLARGE